ncbi:amidohydrolase family protein [Streptomyces sp. NPDC091281]|uniref:N-acyl-D-amino-acid deacylase family protein n=1 Tax=Streptomyces sp. NPDC091281 TaxID=3365985 RepID=UPI0038268CF2
MARANDLVIRGGTVVDGTGAPGRRADVAVSGGRVTEVGRIAPDGRPELDASGLTVAPGFINILSHAYESLQQDPRGLSDLHQGVTTEIFGEGYSLGPVVGRAVEIVDARPREDGVRTAFPRLADFLRTLEADGTGPNVASFVGAHNLRAIRAGADERPLTAYELRSVCDVLDEELAAGALGVGSSLLYAPGAYASTEELTAYATVTAAHDALYVSHIRDEAAHLEKSVREVIDIARLSSSRVHVWHLKASGRDNWQRMPEAIRLIAEARDEGIEISADLYPYEAGGTSLAASIPPWYFDGGEDALLARIADPADRARIIADVRAPGGAWENIYRDAGGAEGVLLQGSSGALTGAAGKTLARFSAERGYDEPLEALLDLVADDPHIEALYFCMSQENIRLGLRQPWVGVCSDAEASSTEPPFADAPTHPRAYGSFARVLGPFVRDGLLTLEEAVRRMTSLPADTLRLVDRGRIRPGAWADLVVFDPDTVQDHATYADPHRYATGTRHVLVNGRPALRDGEPTGELAGRALRRGAR